jgi:uncharacterized damage-inducible protein DinB
VSALGTLLTGQGAFANVRSILRGIELKQMAVRPDLSPHSIYEELWHLVYWQDLLLTWVRGEARQLPSSAAEGWPNKQGPDNLQEARTLVRRFLEGVNAASDVSRDVSRLETVIQGKYTVRSTLESLLAHNSYHLGRIVLLRQLIGIWPPPDGGDSW